VNLDVQIIMANQEETGLEAIGVIRNLSLRGALIETHASMKVNDQLILYVTFPCHADELEISSNAVVRWVQERQVLERKTSQSLMRYLSNVHNATQAVVHAGVAREGDIRYSTR
jgi:hypothetical protein